MRTCLLQFLGHGERRQRAASRSRQGSSWRCLTLLSLSHPSGVFDACTDGLGGSVEEVGSGNWELIATGELTVVAKPLLGPHPVEDGQSDR